MEKKIIGVGAALVDLLIEESNEFVASLGSPKGGMTLVDDKKIQEILEKSKKTPIRVPGGSACNTLVGIGNLGGVATMIGRCGKDELGQFFKQGLESSGVHSHLGLSETPTGRVLSIVTPDAQRTMFTSLGASAELSPSDLRPEEFKGAFLAHLEGYLLFNKPVVDKIVQLAKEYGVKISLDLASFQVVEIMRPYIDELLDQGVDILIANEDEAMAYTKETSEEKSFEVLRKRAPLVVYKLGARGSRIAEGSKVHEIATDKVQALDTTGAGDLWAAGFLYGLSQGQSLDKAGALGSKVAKEVVQVMGACIPAEGWQRIKG